jgi:hypothetical protein
MRLADTLGQARSPITNRPQNAILPHLASAIFMAAMFCAAAFGADSFYLGAWKIDSAVVAPWWDSSTTKPDAAESKTLVGKIVTIKAGEIIGPRPLACKGPQYKVFDIPAEGLFQGAFDEMRRRDKSVDPLKLAAKVGFKGTSWKSLETGCANEIDFHFVDPNTIEFGLNNFVYVMKKQ